MSVMALFTMRRIGLSVCLAAGVAALSGSQTAPTVPTPPVTGRFVEFDVTPSVVCVNVGVPIVRIHFKAQSSNDQCVWITVNGQSIVDGFAGGPLTGVNRCGNGTWEETYGFSLSTVFGTNIPPTVNVHIELAEFSINEGLVLDSRDAAIVTRICDPPGFDTP